jgi:excisionase family DNA binding protein
MAQHRIAPQLLDRGTVAARLGVSVDTVDREVRVGALEAYRIGRTVRIAEGSVCAWLARRRIA